MPLGMHNGPMIRRNLPEFLMAVVMSVLLLLGYSMRDNPGPARTPHPRARVEPRFLLEVESPRGRLRVSSEGQVSGISQGHLTVTELGDLRQAVARLTPGSSQGSWKMRFYDDSGAHEISVDPQKKSPETAHILENLTILGYWKS